MSNLNKILESELIEASAPCRIDMGGTLDISCFYYPLAYMNPCTFNIAIAMRTRVKISSYQNGFVKISSSGFESAKFPIDKIPFDHPMGLMFAIAAHFNIHGIHIQIESSSPPRSALGGSSAAAVALIAAFNLLLTRLNKTPISFDQIPLLAHGIEESVAGVPCGLQDHLAALYGGVNAWYWKGNGLPQPFVRKPLSTTKQFSDLSKHLLLAYCGIPHESIKINSTWIKQFLSGQYRAHWIEISNCTNAFADAFYVLDIKESVRQLNRETEIRMEMTPDVFDDMGNKLVDLALNENCGARFTGAGGGGCIWALGEVENISVLRSKWKKILLEKKTASLLDVNIDSSGLQSKTV